MIKMIDALKRTEIGPVIATHKIKWYRPDGIEDYVTLEIGAPVQAEFEGAPQESKHEHWVCGLRCSLYTEAYNMPGRSSLGAIVRAISFATTLLRQHPAAEQFADNIFPYFGLAVPQGAKPDDFAAEHARPKQVRMPEAWRDQPGYEEYAVLE